MSLVGTECCQGGRQRFAHCLDLNREGECLHARHLLVYMAQMGAKSSELTYSATSIIGCARRQILQRRVDFYEDPNAVVARFVGDAVHHYAHELLAEEEDYVGETRVWADLTMQIPPYEVVLTGKADQRWRQSRVVDLKTTGKIPNVAIPDHVTQVNIYAWLLANGYDEDGFPLACEIAEGAVTYISPNEGREVTYAVPIWPQARTMMTINVLLSAYAPWWLEGRYPEVLRPTYTLEKTRAYTVKRDYRCERCPVRTECDQIATEERGVSPNEYAYWGPDAGEGPVAAPSFSPEFSGAGL